MRDVLFDAPVSNHGARVRMIIRSKQLRDRIEIKTPDTLGGLKSAEYLSLNSQGKMPLYVLAESNYAIAESDTISRYILDHYADYPPSFQPRHILQRTLSNQICRFHDLYITPIQGCMYKPPGWIYGTQGTDRSAALRELKRQLLNIENLLTTFATTYPDLGKGEFLCGEEMSLADVTLFPTFVFCQTLLPRYFNIPEEEFTGPKLRKWWRFMCETQSVAQEVKAEMLGAVEKWIASGRFDAIVQEMREEYVTD
eukprot:gene3469-3800_t